MLEGTALCFYRCDSFQRLREIGLPLMLAASSPRDILVMNFGCGHRSLQGIRRGLVNADRLHIAHLCPDDTPHM